MWVELRFTSSFKLLVKADSVIVITSFQNRLHTYPVSVESTGIFILGHLVSRAVRNEFFVYTAAS